MNVCCLVNPYFGGGIKRHIIEMISGLAHRPTHACTLLANEGDLRKQPSFWPAIGNLRVKNLPIGIRTTERLWKLAGWPSIDQVVGDCDVFYSPFHARLPSRGIPVVMTVHDAQAFETDLPWADSPTHRRFRAKWSTWLPKAGRECARVLTVSDFSKRRLTELVGIDPAKIGVVGNGVSDCFFTAGRTTSQALKPDVLVIGGIRTTKGAADTLAVASQLAQLRSPLTVKVVGQNDPAWAARAKTLPNVLLMGSLADEELATLLASAVALLFLSPYEGFGIPAVEAMATGTPAVVSNRASLPEVVGDAGMVVEPSQHAEIASILERLREDVEFRSALATRGRLHASAFTWEKCVDRLVANLELARQA